MSKDTLLSTIEQKRTQLNQIVQKHGLNSKTTIQYSQELDSLLNEYNKIKHSDMKSLSRN